MNLFLVALLLLFQFKSNIAGLCRQSNNHQNYTCHGFRFNQLTVSRPTKLQILHARIYDCKETRIPNEVLQFPNLENLTISCDITTIDQTAFSNLNHLKELDLSNNTIFELSENLFNSQESLYLLNLTHNRFEQLKKNMFGGLSNLHTLLLSHNSISTLHEKTFNSLRQLRQLYLDNNEISFIPIVIFNRLTKLERLDLSYNNIRLLNELLTHTIGLQYLNLTRNQITELPARVFQTTNLKIIDLSFNELKFLYQEALKLETLEHLYLRNNKLYLFEVTGLGLKNLPLSFLDVRNNRLAFFEESFIRTAKNLKILRLDGNPWDCKCLEEIQTARSYLELDTEMMSEDEDQSACILGTLINVCHVDKTTVSEYYNIFKQQFDRL